MNIFQRLQEVRKKVSYIQKDKKVQSYMAVTHDHVTAEVRPFLVEFGVVIVPSFVSSAVADTGTFTSNEIPIIRYQAVYDVSFVNIDDPADRVTLRIEAHANDQGDKAPGKAVSYATKYAILKLLSLETGEAEEGRIDAKPNTAKQVAVDAFDAMPEDEKKFLQETATAIIAVHENDGDLATHVEGLRLDVEEKLALWSLLPSPVRTAIKKAQAADRISKPKVNGSQPHLAEQA